MFHIMHYTHRHCNNNNAEIGLFGLSSFSEVVGKGCASYIQHFQMRIVAGKGYQYVIVYDLSGDAGFDVK